jgi:hypothetical protein
MPQNNVQSDWAATYPTDLKYQKPSGIPGTITRAISAASAVANVATITVPATTDYVGTTYQITVTGVTPAAYNGTFTGTIASATTITYPLGSTPGAGTVFGSVSYPGIIPIGLSSTLWAHAVPNKPQWTGTQGMMLEVGSEEWLAAQEQAVKPEEAPPVIKPKEEDEEEADEDTEDEEEDVDPPPHRSPPHRGRRR